MFGNIFNTAFQISINIYQKIRKGSEEQRNREKSLYDIMIC